MLFTCLCSSPSCYVWLWWFNFFFTHDFHFGICAHISEIWNKEVITYISRSYYQAHLILMLLFSLKWALFADCRIKIIIYSQDVCIISHLMPQFGVFALLIKIKILFCCGFSFQVHQAVCMVNCCDSESPNNSIS